VYFLPDHNGKNDGKHIAWHNDRRWTLSLDPLVCRVLSGLHSKRLVSQLETAAISLTQYPVQFHRVPVPFDDRKRFGWAMVDAFIAAPRRETERKRSRKTSAAPGDEPPKKPPDYVKGSGNLVGMAFHDDCKSLQDTPLKRPSGFPYDPDNPFDPDNEPSDPATWPNAGNHAHKKDVTK
jgi:hypothetical protein